MMQERRSKLEVRVEFKSNRLSDERWKEAYEIAVPSRSFNIGPELIMVSAKPNRRARSAKKQVTA
jgi:hypothetical protein